MSDDQPTPGPAEASEATEQLPVLRREALLPNERNRGLGTVAVVCTMAGVASGLALATTLMAMQVADTMSTRTCTYRSTVIDVTPVSRDHGFLGITYVFRDGNALVLNVMPDTPAERVGIQKGDRVLSVDGDSVDSLNELQERIVNARPGYRPTIEVKRDHVVRTVNPTLTAWPSPH
jgi:serine protease Do